MYTAARAILELQHANPGTILGKTLHTAIDGDKLHGGWTRSPNHPSQFYQDSRGGQVFIGVAPGRNVISYGPKG